MSKSRRVVQKFTSIEQGEGVGARVRRSIGRPELHNFDPFLLLDEFAVNKPAGFPDHPHRGFETVTYMLEGSFCHEDFCGHAGTIDAGDLQWMTAGKGIVHSEMPNSNIVNRGLQLWVNLKSKDKMVEPRYQELKDKDIPRKKENGTFVKVIAGESMGISSEVKTLTPTIYLDFQMDPNSEFFQKVDPRFNTFIYVIEGEAFFGADEAKGPAHNTIVLSKGKDEEGILIKTKESKVHFVLIGGQPLNEPVFQHGPFVMNTREEIMQAMHDYQLGKNGFERARNWESKIGNQ